MRTQLHQLRFQYSGSYVDPARHHFRFEGWQTEEECRRHVAILLEDRGVKRSSIRIVVQVKKDDWLPHQDGSAAQVFPDLSLVLAMQGAFNSIVNNPELSLHVRLQAEQALRESTVKEALAEARQLVDVLETLQHLLSM